MNISKLTIAFKYIFGGMGSVVGYLLDILNNALNSIDPENKKKIRSAANIALKVASTLKTLQFLCPTKWQSAYMSTIGSVECVIYALDDFKLEEYELQAIQDDFKKTIIAWKGDDDETCVDGNELED